MAKKLELNAAKNKDGVFDVDAYHAMQQRDEQLIQDQIIHGVTSNEFVYSFPMDGKPVTGVSVVGARELAYQYGGIKHRIIATMEKRGGLITARSFEPMAINVFKAPDLEDQDDFYEVVIEIQDTKKGNTLQVRKREDLHGKRKDGSFFQRPHYDVIAESKAYRNGVLNILPQSVVKQFKDRCIAAGQTNGQQPAERTIDDLRAGATRYAMSNGIPLDRKSVNALSYQEVSDLARQLNDLDRFRNTAEQMGLLATQQDDEQEEGQSESYTLE